VKTKIGGSMTIRLSHGAKFQIIPVRASGVVAFMVLVFMRSPRSFSGGHWVNFLWYLGSCAFSRPTFTPVFDNETTTGDGTSIRAPKSLRMAQPSANPYQRQEDERPNRLSVCAHLDVSADSTAQKGGEHKNAK
jgi:hypothetical protein